MILKNIPPFSFGETLPLPRPPSPPNSKHHRIFKGDSRSYEVIVANDDENSTGNNIEVNFKILEGEGEVKLDICFIKVNSLDVKDEKKT